MRTFYLLIALLVFTKSSLKSQNATWSEDVSCIFYSHCTNCHNPGGVAPFSLMKYNQAYPFRNSIKNSVISKYMPPFPPNADYQQYAHQNILSQAEIDLIANWVDQGAPEGDTSLAPDEPVYVSNHEIPNPDAIFKIPNYTVPMLTTDDMYRCFTIPTNFTTDQYVTAVEIDPGNDSIVHHVIAFYDVDSMVLDLDNADPDPGYTSFGSTGSSSSLMMAAWVPGQKADFFPNGMGVKVSAGSFLILQVHYPVGSTGKLDSTSIRLKFSPVPLRPLYMAPLLEHTSTTMTDGPLVLPPNVVKTFHNHFQIPPPYDATVIGVAPHAHLTCESMKAFGVLPNGDTIPFIDIPSWDFHWQGIYYFKQPFRIPVGTNLYGEATYDNTSANPNNPNSPPDWMFLGEDTDEEMMLFFFTFTYYMPGDENIIIDSSSHYAHHLDCVTEPLGIKDLLKSESPSWTFYPNPCHDKLYISSAHLTPEKLEIIDLQGKVWIKNSTTLKEGVSVSHLPAGMYVLKLYDQTHVSCQKLMIER